MQDLKENKDYQREVDHNLCGLYIRGVEWIYMCIVCMCVYIIVFGCLYVCICAFNDSVC